MSSDEMNFDHHALGSKSTRDNHVINYNDNRRRSLAFEFTFFPEDPNKLCQRLFLIIQAKESGNDSNKVAEELVTIIDILF